MFFNKQELLLPPPTAAPEDEQEVEPRFSVAVKAKTNDSISFTNQRQQLCGLQRVSSPYQIKSMAELHHRSVQTQPCASEAEPVAGQLSVSEPHKVPDMFCVVVFVSLKRRSALCSFPQVCLRPSSASLSRCRSSSLSASETPRRMMRSA